MTHMGLDVSMNETPSNKKRQPYGRRFFIPSAKLNSYFASVAFSSSRTFS